MGSRYRQGTLAPSNRSWYARGWDSRWFFLLTAKPWPSPLGRTSCSGSGIRQRVPALEGHRWPVHALAFAPKDGALIRPALRPSANGIVLSPDEPSCVDRVPRTHAICGGILRNENANLPARRPPVQLRDLLTDKVLHEFAEVKGSYYHGCFSADGRTVALSRRTNSMRLPFSTCLHGRFARF